MSRPWIHDKPLKSRKAPAMTDVLDGVRDHYRATGLTERLKTVLTVLGPEDQLLTPQQLEGRLGILTAVFEAASIKI